MKTKYRTVTNYTSDTQTGGIGVTLRGYFPVKGGRVTASQLDLTSLAPVSVAVCGRLQLGVAHCVTLVAILQEVHN